MFRNDIIRVYTMDSLSGWWQLCNRVQQCCLTVTQVPSPHAQLAAVITVMPEAERDRGVGVFFPLLLFKATLRSSPVAAWKVELGRTQGAPVANAPSLMSSLHRLCWRSLALSVTSRGSGSVCGLGASLCSLLGEALHFCRKGGWRNPWQKLPPRQRKWDGFVLD